MKTFLLLTALLVSSNAFAFEKMCFGLKSDSDAKGTHFKVAVTKKKVEVADGEYKGSYDRAKGQSVAGKDGHTYLDYNWGGEEGCSDVLVDEDLVSASGKGELKFRCRGEGFSDTKFYCRNEKDDE